MFPSNSIVNTIIRLLLCVNDKLTMQPLKNKNKCKLLCSEHYWLLLVLKRLKHDSTSTGAGAAGMISFFLVTWTTLMLFLRLAFDCGWKSSNLWPRQLKWRQLAILLPLFSNQTATFSLLHRDNQVHQFLSSSTSDGFKQ